MKKTLFGAVLALAISIVINHADAAPIHEAASLGKTDEVERLLNEGAAINEYYKSDADCDEGYTPLLFAAKRGRLDTVRFLVNHGADINAIDTEGYTALMVAIQHYQFAVVEYLLQVPGIDVDHVNVYDETALDSAKITDGNIAST